jgi:hypothetical protein
MPAAMTCRPISTSASPRSVGAASSPDGALRPAPWIDGRWKCAKARGVQAPARYSQRPLPFGSCRLLGIKLMPRMRGLSDAIFYRPAKTIRYEHIDALFGGEIDWHHE